MGVALEDLRGGGHRLDCHWWQWRATVQLIRSFDLFENERLELLSQGVGELAEQEAHQLAAILDINVLPKLLNHQAPCPMPDSNYVPTLDWLTRLSEFCRNCGGLRVSY